MHVKTFPTVWLDIYQNIYLSIYPSQTPVLAQQLTDRWVGGASHGFLNMLLWMWFSTPVVPRLHTCVNVYILDLMKDSRRLYKLRPRKFSQHFSLFYIHKANPKCNTCLSLVAPVNIRADKHTRPSWRDRAFCSSGEDEDVSLRDVSTCHLHIHMIYNKTSSKQTENALSCFTNTELQHICS